MSKPFHLICYLLKLFPSYTLNSVTGSGHVKYKKSSQHVDMKVSWLVTPTPPAIPANYMNSWVPGYPFQLYCDQPYFECSPMKKESKVRIYMYS